MQKISAAPLTTCPSCGASTFAKQMSAAGFQLKGSGWYATDFKGSTKPAGSGAASTTPPAAAASESASSSDSSASPPKACGGPCACH